jgi:hypothetical protein
MQRGLWYIIVWITIMNHNLTIIDYNKCFANVATRHWTKVLANYGFWFPKMTAQYCFL